MWVLRKYNTEIGTCYGEPIYYVLFNCYGVHIPNPRNAHQWTTISDIAPWRKDLYSIPFREISLLESFLLFGLHNGTAEEIGKICNVSDVADQ